MKDLIDILCMITYSLAPPFDASIPTSIEATVFTGFYCGVTHVKG